MAILTNLAGDYTPIREGREVTGTLGALNAEVVMPLQGEGIVIADLRSAGAISQAIQFQGTIDGTNYINIPALDLLSQQYIQSLAISAVPRTFLLETRGFKAIRLLNTNWTSGTITVAFRAEVGNPLVMALPFPATSTFSVTAAAGVAATLTIPSAGAGLYHYIVGLYISKFATALLTAAAAPVIVTTTNIPFTTTAPSFDFPADAAPQGSLVTRSFEPNQPLKSTVANVNTVITCPATPSVIWKATAIYYIGA